MIKTVVNYPSWHADARRKYANGATADQLADEYGLSTHRIRQIVGPSWQVYLLLFHRGDLFKSMGAVRVALESGIYEFQSVKADHPSVRMHARLAAKRTAKIKEVKLSKLRTFPSVSKIHEGRTLKGAVIKCYKCGGTSEYYNNQGTVSTEHLPKEFARRGWDVGKNANSDMCPSCLKGRRGRPPKLQAEEVSKVFSTPVPPAADTAAIKPELKITLVSHTPAQPSLPPVADADKPMDRTDRRLVFSRLNELYIDEKTGYSGDWTDAKVAADMGVPVDWIAEVRNSDFGPEINADIRAAKFNDLKKLAESIQRDIVLADKKIEQMQALDTKLTDAMDVVNKAIDRYEELSKNLETEDKRIEDIISAFNTNVAEFKKMVKDIEPTAFAKA